MRKLMLIAVAVFTMMNGEAFAQTITNAGFVNSNNVRQVNFGAQSNILAGFSDSIGYRSFVTFSVPASAVPYFSATLSLPTSTVEGGPNTLEIFDVTSNVLSDPEAAVFADLGTGISFGSVAGLSSNQNLVLTLNAQGLSALNAARGGSITFGLTNATIGGGLSDVIFGNSQLSSPRTLTLNSPAAVPTLSEWAMILFGLLLAGGAALLIQRRQVIA